MTKKILIIDDDRTNVLLLKNRLEAQNYEVFTAYDGDVGLEKTKTEKPDLILLDVEMPNMNGYTFLTELKKIPELKSTSVIVLTAHANMQPIFTLKGIKAYCVKPIEMESFLQKIKECLA